MSRKRVVQTINQNGANFGQISSPDDILKSQEFAQNYIQQITNDFLTVLNQQDIAGFAATLAAGLSFNLSNGRIYQNGIQYESGDLQLQCVAAEAQDRIDIVVATLAADSPVNQQFTAFQRLRTAQELASNASLYVPQQFQVPLEKANLANVFIKKGTAAANPVAPQLAAGEIPLYTIRVPANATNLLSSNFSDLRRLAANLRTIQNQVLSNQGQITTIQQQILQALSYQTLIVDFSASFGRADSLLGILQEIANTLLVLRYRYPTTVSGDGKLPARGNLDGSTPVVDIDISSNVSIQFGTGFQGFNPANFLDQNLNARYVTVSGNAKTNPNQLLAGTSFQNAGNADTIRFNAPNSTKALYMNRSGKLFLRDAVTPSNGEEILLAKIIPNGTNTAPTVKTYRNLRSGLVVYSKVATSSDATSRQFEYDFAFPLGVQYFRYYAINNSTKNLYFFTPPGSVNFDAPTNLTGMNDGDTWVVECTILSAF